MIDLLGVSEGFPDGTLSMEMAQILLLYLDGLVAYARKDEAEDYGQWYDS